MWDQAWVKPISYRLLRSVQLVSTLEARFPKVNQGGLWCDCWVHTGDRATDQTMRWERSPRLKLSAWGSGAVSSSPSPVEMRESEVSGRQSSKDILKTGAGDHWNVNNVWQKDMTWETCHGSEDRNMKVKGEMIGTVCQNESMKKQNNGRLITVTQLNLNWPTNAWTEFVLLV